MILRVNTYMAALIITVVGSGAALLIINIANATDFPIERQGTATLEQDILNTP